MFTISMRTIFVGCPPQQMTAILTRMGRVGFGSYAVDSLKEGRELIEGGGFELVLSLETLQDGNGYDLVAVVRRQEGSLFIGVETSAGCLWLPVLDHGERVLGTGAMDYGLRELELADVLSNRSEPGKATSRWVPPAPPKVLELKGAPLSSSVVVAKEVRKQQQIIPLTVPFKPTRALRVSAAKTIENRASGDVGPDTRTLK
jgi:hypothetical protein